MVDVPKPTSAAKQQKNVYYWADGTQMVAAGGGDRTGRSFDFAQIPEAMQNAVIAAENESF